MDFNKILAFFLVVVWANTTLAAPVDNLYQAEISAPATQAGFPSSEQVAEGMRRVLVKTTGNDAVLSSQVIIEQLAVSEQYLQKFSYPQSPVAQNLEQQPLILDFNAFALDELIKGAGFKLLGSQRPAVLLWLASNQAGQQYLSVDSEIVKQFQAEAGQRGLPVQLPIFDLEDQLALPLSDLWGLFETSIDKASARYAPDAILAARIQVSESGFAAVDWVLMHAKSSQRYSVSGPLQQVLPELVNTAADQLFTLSSTPAVGEYEALDASITLNLSNISQLSDYIHVMDYLGSLPVIKKINTQSIAGSELSLKLYLDNTMAILQQALALDPRLHALDFTYAEDGSEVLHYRWQEQ